MCMYMYTHLRYCVQLVHNSQLGPDVRGSTSLGFPNIRWQQTGNEGFLPNDYMQRFFMAVAMDLPDFDSPHGT